MSIPSPSSPLPGGQLPGGPKPITLDDLRTVDAHRRTHLYADTNLEEASLHHTLGTGPLEAAPGDHGKRHLKGTTITGSKAGNTALASVIAALVKLGAADSTT